MLSSTDLKERTEKHYSCSK